MIDDPTEIEVTLLLCDAAQSVAGKLYILGGGWSQVVAPPNAPVQMSLALRITVPWGETNRQIPLSVRLCTADGEAVDFGHGPIEQRTMLELGRPPGVERGTQLDAMIALNAGVLPLAAGRYVWTVEVDDQVKARAPFRVLNTPQLNPIGG